MLKKLINLAWRNIWRNKRRAIITSLSIVASLFFVLFMRQMQLWTYDYNIKNSVSNYVGYIQITDSAYVDEKIIDNSLDANAIPAETIEKLEHVSGVFPRMQSGALVSTGIKSKFAGVMGIRPETDNKVLKLQRKLAEGSLLSDNDSDVLITEKMAKYYQVHVGDTLVLIGQGFQGYTAAGLYNIKGIIRFSAGDLSNMVFMSLPESQRFLSAPERFTHYLINIEDSQYLNEVARQVKPLIANEPLTARTWEEVLPGLKQGLELDSNSGLLIVGILYMIVAFGMIGTIIMLYNERQFEFGVMNAIGMHKKTLILVTQIELTILALIGIVVGNLVSIPLLYHLNVNPIELQGNAAKGMIEQGFEPYMGTGLYTQVFINNSLIILVISFFASFYIVSKLWKLNPLNAMRQN